jgi:two-component system, response regulator YesN
LELSEKLSVILPEIKVIIISGYDDFKYVNRAIKFNAISYLLKPIDENELNLLLKKAVSQIELLIQTKELKESLPYLLENLVSDVVDYNSSENSERFLKWIKSKGWLGKQYTGTLFQFDNQRYDRLNFKKVLGKCIKQIAGQDFEVILFNRENDDFGAFIVNKSPTKDIAIFLKKVSNALERDNILGVSIAVGNSFAKPEDFRVSFLQAEEALREKPLNLIKNIIFYSQKQDTSAINIPVDLHNSIIAYISMNERGKLEEVFEKLQEYILKTGKITMQDVRNFFITAVSGIIRILPNRELNDRDLIKKGLEFISGIDKFNNLQSIIQWFRDYCIKVLDNYENQKGSIMGKVISEVTEYIKNNFGEQITINMLANKYHVNSAYLSSMFKKKTGECFTAFLTRVRMEKAVEYISGTNTTISQIARMVGYEDVRYFGKLFRKYSGKTPTEFKDMNNNTL